MKRLSLLLCLCMCMLGTVKAQWATQNVKFSRAGMLTMSISAPDANNLWAIGIDTSFTRFNVEFSRSTNGGTTWAGGTLGSTLFLNQITAITAVDGNTAWATVIDLPGMRGKIYKTSNGGSSWTQQGSSAFAAPDGSPFAIHFFDANNGVVVGDPNGGYLEIHTTTNGGTTWTRVPQANIPAMNPNEYTTGQFHVNGNNAWFATDEGRIYRSTNKGLNWTVYNTTKTDIYNITFKDAQNGLMIADGDLMRSTNGGQTWTTVNHTGPLHFGGLAYVPGTSGTYVSTGFDDFDKGSSFSTDNGLTWQSLETTRSHSVVKFVNATTGWSGGVTTSASAGGINRFTGSFTTTGTPETFAASQVQIYPNPGNGLFYISLADMQSENMQVVVRNAVGQEVLSLTQGLSGQNQTFSLDLSQQPKGIYIATLIAGEKVMTQKLVVE